MTQSTPYTQMARIHDSINEVPTDSIVSRTVCRNGGFKAIVFAFATGQELSEHTASVPAVIQILEGECDVTLGQDRFEAQAGFWAHLEARLPHSIYARTPVKMLLLMLDNKAGA